MKFQTMPSRSSTLLPPQLIAIVLFALGACGQQDHSSMGAHEPTTHDAAHADHAASGSVTPPAGTLWPTDPPLREAMGRIETAVQQSESAYHQGTFAQPDAQRLATQVESDVRYMIENCKLAPEPDAALHVLIARMMNAAGALKTNPTAPEGVPALVAVIHDYRATFDQEAGRHTP